MIDGEHRVDMVGNGSDLAFRFSRTQDEIIGDRGECCDVQDKNVGGFFFEGCQGNRRGLRFRVWYDRLPPDRVCGELYRIRPGPATWLRGLARFGHDAESPKRRPHKEEDARE